MQNHQESLNSEIQTLTEHLQNLTNRTFKNQIKILTQDQLQNNYSAKLLLQQSKYKQIALQYNDSRANLTQKITQNKNRISTIAKNQQELSQTVQDVVQEQSILRHLNSSELNETLIKVESLKGKINNLSYLLIWLNVQLSEILEIVIPTVDFSQFGFQF